MSVLVFFLLACQVSYSFSARPPSAETSVCLPESVGWEVGPTGDGRAGHSVALLSVGTGEGLVYHNETRLLAIGAPGAEGDDLAGLVRVVEADVGTGALLPGGGSVMNQDLSGPPRGKQHGWALLAADVQDCMLYRSFTPDTACGQELLVGAPDRGTGSTTGFVTWWRPRRDIRGALEYGGLLSPPHGTPNGARYGSSLAAWAPPPDPQAPWYAAPAPVPWVAVGAPGQERVYVYTVTSSSVSPIAAAPVQVLSPPSIGVTLLGKGFGEALWAGDFDGDGVVDLAVGAPGDNRALGGDSRGRVVVYRGGDFAGVPLSPIPLDAVVLEADKPVRDGHADEFGVTMVSAYAVEGAAGQLLVVGAPSANKGEGGLCTFQLGADGTNTFSTSGIVCKRNPRATPGSYWASALAFGNFIAADGAGMPDTDEAWWPELAVGAPGRLGGEGEVQVFLATASGPDFTTTLAELRDPSVRSTGLRPAFGSALAWGHVQETPWADLAVGSPERWGSLGVEQGQGTLTRAWRVDPGACSDIIGIWETTGADGLPARVNVFLDAQTSAGGTHLLFQDALLLDFLDGSGDVCQFYDPTAPADAASPCFDLYLAVARGSHLALDGAFPCGRSCTPYRWSQGGGDFIASVLQSLGVWDVMDAAQQAQATSTVLDFELTFQPAGSACNPSGVDRLEFDVQIPPGIWGLADLVDSATALAYGDGGADCFDSTCDVPHPALDAELVGADICE